MCGKKRLTHPLFASAKYTSAPIKIPTTTPMPAPNQVVALETAYPRIPPTIARMPIQYAGFKAAWLPYRSYSC